MIDRESVTLRDGWTIGERHFRDVVLREVLVSDIIAAAKVSEGNDTIAGVATIARQIAFIACDEEQMAGPFDLAFIGKLPYRDLNLLMAARDKLEARGRPPGE